MSRLTIVHSFPLHSLQNTTSKISFVTAWVKRENVSMSPSEQPPSGRHFSGSAAALAHITELLSSQLQYHLWPHRRTAKRPDPREKREKGPHHHNHPSEKCPVRQYLCFVETAARSSRKVMMDEPPTQFRNQRSSSARLARRAATSCASSSNPRHSRVSAKRGAA